MSIIHRIKDPMTLGKSIRDVYRYLGSYDTPELYAENYTVMTMFDVPWGAGNSLDRQRVYVDARLYQEIIDGVLVVDGLTPRDILAAWCDHEHTEICTIAGDNPVDNYQAAHECSQCKEHEFIVARGVKIAAYEDAIWPALRRCYNRPFKNVPKDIWCGPVLDKPTPRDHEIIKQLVRLGITDADRQSKYDVHYGVGATRCGDCTMYRKKEDYGSRGLCVAVDGPIRYDRNCDLWEQKRSNTVSSVRPQRDPLRPFRELKE